MRYRNREILLGGSDLDYKLRINDINHYERIAERFGEIEAKKQIHRLFYDTKGVSASRVGVIPNDNKDKK